MKLVWKGFRKPRSVRRQLIVGVTGVHMVLMVAFVYDLVSRQERFLMERARERTLHQAAMLASSSVPQFIAGDKAGLHDILQSLSRDPSVKWASVTDERGRVLGDLDSHRVGLYLSDPVSLSVLRGTHAAAIVHEGATRVAAAAPVLASGDVLGWAWVTGDLRADETQMQSVRRTGFIYTFIAVIAGAVFAVVLANGITKQLRLLVAGARRLAEDRLDDPVPVVTQNDVGVLAKAFNHAMHRLAQERALLVQARNRLEAEVRERRRAEEQLKSANRAITSANESLQQFAYAASHDLQEPLRAVSAYSELLKRRYSGSLEGDGLEFLAYVWEGAERMQRMIRALLEYSRAGAPGGEPPSQVDTAGALRAALENLATAIEQSGAAIAHDALPPVVAHEVAITQLFQNLIGNAIKYAGDRTPEIRVWAETSGSETVFSVSDNGIGIPPEQHERVFRIFKRAHAGRYPGNGVGLAICSKIVERYAGRIWVESQEGSGSTFRFALPRTPHAASAQDNAA